MKSELKQPAWVETWARRIETLGLSSMAIALVEIARPYGFLGSQALLMAQPLMTGIVDGARLDQVLTLLDDAETLERLKMRLEGKGARI
ncbi:MAG TPA: hypothetical protein G4N99_14340 [Thermoflexia bacterium]|nr:hypothetical protein [Thermoflexia bacterium]